MTTSYMALGYQCNHNCISCPLSTYDKMMGSTDFGMIQREIEMMCDNASPVHVILSGGEPTLYHHFSDVAGLLSEKCAYVTLLTNSTRFSSQDFTDMFVNRIRINKKRWNVSTAIHSLNPAIHDTLTNTPGSLSETLQGLDHLIAVDIQVSIKFIISRLNYEKMPEIMKELDNRFPDNVHFYICGMDYAGHGGKNSEQLFVDFRTIEPYLEKSLDLFCRNDRRRIVQLNEIPLCAVDPYYWSFYKKSQGHVDKYFAPWQSDEEGIYLESACSVDYDECKNCDVKEFCEGAWRTAYRLGHGLNNFLVPVKCIE